MGSSGRRRLLGAALALALSTALPATAAAQPGDRAACTWHGTALALPAGISDATVTGEATAALLVGNTWTGQTFQGLIWRNGVPELMPAFADGGENYPHDVNSSGVVVGTKVSRVQVSPSEFINLARAYRYQDGVYQLLSVPPSKLFRTAAVGVNEAGDIVGSVGRQDGTGSTSTLVWLARDAGRYRVVGAGTPVGVDERGRVVTSERKLWSPDGTEVSLYSGSRADLFAAGHILGRSGAGDPVGLLEWDDAGFITRKLPDGVAAHGVNTAGTVVGEYYRADDDWGVGVWRDGQLNESVADPRPTNVVALTEDETIVGNVRPSGSESTPMLWRCS